MPPPPAEIAPAIDAFLRHSSVERGLSPRTIEAYGRDLAMLAEFLGRARVPRLADVTPEHLAAFSAALAQRGLAARSRARALVATRRLLRFAGATDAFRADPLRGVASPRLDRRLPRVLRPDESAALIEAAGQGEGPLALRDRAMLEVLYGAGLRVSELVGLPRAALERRGGWLRVVGKGRVERMVPLGEPALAAVTRYLEAGWPVLARTAQREPAALFLTARARAMTRQNFFARLRAIARRAGIASDSRVAARAAPRIRHRSARRRRRSARRPDPARPRRPLDHPDLHPREPRAAARDGRAPAPERVRRRCADVSRETRAHAALASLPPASTELVRAVLRAADADGVSVLLVGGPVRDLLLGRPLVDVDLLIEDPDPARAGALAASAAGGAGKVTRHDRFGTAALETPDAVIDFATVRSESYAHPGALPLVAPGDLAQDLARRDFSVNALAVPLSRAARARHPEIVDLFDGAADLSARRLRILHDKSFHDDPTRALRAARLGPRLGFALTQGTRSALRSALRDGCFGPVSGDRLRRELERVFEDAHRGLDPAQALRVLDDWHVLGALEPGLDLPRKAAVPLRRLGRAIAAPPWKSPRWRPWMAGFGVWLAPVPAALRRRALRRFALRGDPARRVAELPRDVERAVRALAKRRGRGAIDAVLGALSEEALYAVYASGPSALRRRVARYASDDRHRRLPISGDDLVAAGLSGPSVGRALERIRAAYLDGALSSREEALALAHEVARRSRRPKR